ncbi:hypothetical protein F5Y07DRAFT_51240 [Xylaria sp. FL0933]|nr:hypothetical protein F5Y07DRAFT_51240 [Xylaria sp. FL0933]
MSSYRSFVYTQPWETALKMHLPSFRLHGRQASHAPCPQGNGTMIGDQQKFVVFCNTRFRGDEVLRQKADSLATCAGLCTTFQNPRCEGAQFKDNNDCVLLGNLVPEGTRPTRFFDSAAAIFPQPGPTSSCSQQGTGNTFLSQNSRFTLQCGKIVNGGDLEQQFQMTFESCIAACSANPTCSGVSYDPSQTAGFQNCYLKTTIDPANVFAKAGVDSAILASDVNQVADASASASVSVSVSTLTTAGAGAETTTYVTVIPDPGTVSIPVTVTPSSSTAALAAATPKASTKAASSGADDADGVGGVNNSGRPRFGGPAPSASSNAWIAAPVIGGIAALTLLLAIFVLWQRRRRRDDGPSSRRGDGGGGPMSRAARGLEGTADRIARGRIFGGGGSEKTRLRDSSSDEDSRYGNSRSGFKVVSGSGRRIGLSEQQQTALGTGPGLGGMIVTTGGGKVVDRMETGAGGGGIVRSSSSAGLRDSQNGLRQNRPTGEWLDSRPGIPDEFRGPQVR